MPLRLVSVVLPDASAEEARRLEDEFPVIDLWYEEEEDRLDLRVLADAEQTEGILDHLEARFGGRKGFRLVLLPVEASLPRPEEPEGEEEPTGAAEDAGQEEEPPSRISREELHTQLSDSAELSSVYLTMIALSAVVCSFGLLTSDVAVVIGAMVIAPLLGPLVALSLAITLADQKLAFRGSRTAAAGVASAFAVSVVIGILVPVDPALPEIAARTSPGLGHLGVALAAGSAGTLAFTTGLPSAVIGVMVAVALVPPLVAAGLLVGGGYHGLALGAGLLTLVNLISINLAGVVTFVAQGIQPHRWWEAERARRSTALALAIWTLLLLALVAAILWAGGEEGPLR